MAKILPIMASQFVIFFLSLLLPSFGNRRRSRLCKKPRPEATWAHLGSRKKNLANRHFRFYWHDIVSGRNPSVLVVRPSSNTSTGFGLVSMIDDPLTLKPSLNSRWVGRAQGLNASAAQQELGLLMVMNFAFIEGKYNGSTISVLGRNAVFSAVREMPVIGGSGLFRFARGYVQARTRTSDIKTGDATVEYNVYVLHY